MFHPCPFTPQGRVRPIGAYGYAALYAQRGKELRHFVRLLPAPLAIPQLTLSNTVSVPLDSGVQKAQIFQPLTPSMYYGQHLRSCQGLSNRKSAGCLSSHLCGFGFFAT